jgi:regulator of cell morphogenesis and NO signaling
MFLQPFEINGKSLVRDIVGQDYRTAEVFRRHGIGYCCGGKWPVEMACEMQGVDPVQLQAELEVAIRTVPVPNQLDFGSWSIDFLTDYIVHVHHQYLKKYLPDTKELLEEFVIEHAKKFSYLSDLEKQFDTLVKQLYFSMKKEEEVLFPYIRQVAHAHRDKEPYAVLLVRTLRKPFEDRLSQNHQTVTNIIISIRELTTNYTIPSNVCTSHKVVLSKLKELDQDIMQHLYLEEAVLFPKAMAIEQEVLAV